jgi:chromosome segregation ATPase
MKQHERSHRTSCLAVLAASLLGLSGCATSSEMDQFKQALNQRLDILASSLQADGRRIQAQLDGQSKRQQELARSVETMKSGLESEVHAIRDEISAQKTETKEVLEELVTSETIRGQMMKDLRLDSTHLRKALDEYAGKTHQELGKIEAVAQEGSKDIRNLQQALAAFSTRLEQLPSLVNHVGSELHSLSQTLFGGYRLEEAALRERLKSVEQVLKQLEPTAVHTTQATTHPAPPSASKAAIQSAGQTGSHKP